MLKHGSQLTADGNYTNVTLFVWLRLVLPFSIAHCQMVLWELELDDYPGLAVELAKFSTTQSKQKLLKPSMCVVLDQGEGYSSCVRGFTRVDIRL